MNFLQTRVPCSTHPRSRTILSAATVVGFCVSAAACGGGESKVFGEQSEPCPPTVLTNGFDDDQKIAAGTDCFMAELEAGRLVMWDVLAVTVEGDTIPIRYEYDGQIVRITADYSRDTFGSGGVTEQRCDGLRRTGHLPEGIDCNSSNGDGFKSDSLPGGS